MNETKNVSKRTRNPIFFRMGGGRDKDHRGHVHRFTLRVDEPFPMIRRRTVIFLVRVATQSIPKKRRKKSRRADCLAGRDGLIHWKNAMLATSSFHYVSQYIDKLMRQRK